MNEKFKEAIVFDATIVDPLPGEPKSVEIPGSLYDDKNHITRDEAIKMGYLKTDWVKSQESKMLDDISRALEMKPAIEFFEKAPQPASSTECDTTDFAPANVARTNDTIMPIARSEQSHDSVHNFIDQEPFEEPHIFFPQNAEADGKTCGVIGVQRRIDSCEAVLLRKAREDIPLKIYEGVLFYHDTERCYWRPITDDELKLIINALYGEEILKYGRQDKTYDSLVKLLHCESSFVVMPKDDGYYGNLWPFKNFIVDSRTGGTIANDGKIFNRYCLKFDYDPNARCPYFEQFIKGISHEDPSLIELHWKTIGYLLSSDTHAKKFFVYSGVKDSGKSLLANVLCGMTGLDSVTGMGLNDFGERFGLQTLIGKQLNVCMDLPDERLKKSSVAKLKQLTGGDLVHTDIKNHLPVDFRNSARLLFGTNHRIQIESGDDPAFWDRCVEIPFTQSIPKERQDPFLLQKFSWEYAGIANAAMAAYRRLKQGGYLFPKIIVTDDDDLTKLGDRGILQKAIDSCFDITGNAEDAISSADAYRIYVDFCRQRSIDPLGQTALSRELGKYGTNKKKKDDNGASVHFFLGIRSKSNL